MADIDANLPTRDSSDGIDGSSAPETTQQVGGVDNLGNLQTISTDTAGRVNVNATAQPGVDIGDVTVNNGSGANAVNIQDGGNSITVDGTVGATQSGTWNINNISGTISLPTGAATSALQTTGNSSLSSIDGKLSTKSGSLATNSISNGGGSQGAITVGTSAVLVNVSGTNLANRVNVTLHNNSVLTTLYWGYTSGVTTSSGTPIAAGQSIAWNVGPSTNIYVIAGTAGNNARVTEAAS